MALHSIFRIREQHTPSLVELLDSVVLGTNGAHYRHLDTAEKIEECDNPLHLSMERNEKVIGNVTFCRRAEHWYIRYFAFSQKFQSTGKRKSEGSKSNFLKTELNTFFEDAFNGDYADTNVESFYAYVDPNNEKSLWMSETFGFETIGHIATQTFSRVRTKQSKRLEKLTDWNEVQPLVESTFKEHAYYFDAQTKKTPFYVLKDDQNEIIAMAKISTARWQIRRLPGKFGGFLTRLIPFIPGLRKIIRPKDHTFIVPEAVIVKDNDPTLLTELFEGILYAEKEHLIIWWTDEKEELYQHVKDIVKWGLLHKLVGVNRANVVCKQNPNSRTELKVSPIYTVGIDFI